MAYGSVAVVSLGMLRQQTKAYLKESLEEKYSQEIREEKDSMELKQVLLKKPLEEHSKESPDKVNQHHAWTTTHSEDPFRFIDDLTMQYLIQSTDHLSLYTSNNMGEWPHAFHFTSRRFNTYANEVISTLPEGIEITTQFLLYSSLQSLSSITTLLEQVFIMIDIIITVVAAYVITILMLSSTKEKLLSLLSPLMTSFELALLRIIGLRKNASLQILLLQVLLFAIPGIIVGLVLSLLLYLLLAVILNKHLFLNLPLFPPASSYIVAVVVGVIAPVISIIPPSLSFSKQQLIQAIDLQHTVAPAFFHHH